MTRQRNYEFHIPVRRLGDKQISPALLIKNDGAGDLKTGAQDKRAPMSSIIESVNDFRRSLAVSHYFVPE